MRVRIRAVLFLDTISHQAFRQREQLSFGAVGPPDDPAIILQANYMPVRRAAKSFDAIPGFPIGGFG